MSELLEEKSVMAPQISPKDIPRGEENSDSEEGEPVAPVILENSSSDDEDVTNENIFAKLPYPGSWRKTPSYCAFSFSQLLTFHKRLSKVFKLKMFAPGCDSNRTPTAPSPHTRILPPTMVRGKI